MAKNDSFDLLTFPDICHPTNTPCYSFREDQDALTSRVLIPLHPLFPCVPFPVLPFLLVYVMHQLRDSFGSLSFSSLCLSLSFLCGSSNPSSLVLYFLILTYFASAITFTCTHSNGFFVFVNVDVLRFHTIQSHPSLANVLFLPSVSRSSYFLPHSHTSSTCDFVFSTFICLDWTSPLQLLTSNPSFIEWPLSYDHLSPAPTPLSPPLSFYLARRTSFPPWVLQTPV